VADYNSAFTGLQIDAALGLANSAVQPATTLAGYGITNGQPLATVLTNTTAAFTAPQASAIIANTAKVTNATHTGDAAGATALTVTGINGTSLASLTTGLLKNTTSTGLPSIAVNSDLPAMTATVGGAVPTPPNNTTTFLRGDGIFATPSGGGTVTNVTGTAPIASSGGSTPSISIVPATGSVPGSMSAADKTKLDAFSGTNTGDQTSIVGITGTKAQFDTAVTDGNILYVGDVTTNATHTGDVTGATALTIANDAVTNAKAANMATATIKGRTTAGTGDPEDLTDTQVRTLLNVADGATANSTDATLLARANHTGTQAVATITGLGTAATTAAADYATAAQGTLATDALPKSGGTLIGAITIKEVVETVFALTGTTPALEPANGTIQTWTLTANSTPTDSLVTGESILVMVNDGTAFTITWPSVTWVNNGAVAPTLATTGFTVISLWKVSSVLYGALVGNGS